MSIDQFVMPKASNLFLDSFESSWKLVLGHPELGVQLASSQTSDEGRCPPQPVIVPVPARPQESQCPEECRYGNASVLLTSAPTGSGAGLGAATISELHFRC